MRFLLALILGIALGIAAVWYYQSGRASARFQKTGQQIEDAAKSAGNVLQEKLRDLKLHGGDITNELARTGRVIRQKAQQAGQAISDATADARVTAEIKAKLLRDPDLSVWNISVNTTDGVVTLSGTAASAKGIGRAMLLAMETDGVRKVVSTLQVRP